MKKLFIIANWKSNKTTNEAYQWITEFESKINPGNNSDKEVIICPSFISLPSLKAYILQKDLPYKLGAQDISPFTKGAHTGEVNAEQIAETGEYALIGHSERRKELGENDFLIQDKVARAIEAALVPILCVQGVDTPIPQGVPIVAYEPIFAIGTGNPDTPEDAENVASEIKKSNPFVEFVLYGGSVTPEDVKSFTSLPSVNGVLVGGASLDVEKFVQIIENA